MVLEGAAFAPLFCAANAAPPEVAPNSQPVQMKGKRPAIYVVRPECRSSLTKQSQQQPRGQPVALRSAAVRRVNFGIFAAVRRVNFGTNVLIFQNPCKPDSCFNPNLGSQICVHILVCRTLLVGYIKFLDDSDRKFLSNSCEARRIPV